MSDIVKVYWSTSQACDRHRATTDAQIFRHRLYQTVTEVHHIIQNRYETIYAITRRPEPHPPKETEQGEKRP